MQYVCKKSASIWRCVCGVKWFASVWCGVYMGKEKRNSISDHQVDIIRSISVNLSKSAKVSKLYWVLLFWIWIVLFWLYHFRGSRKKVGGGGVCPIFPNRRNDRTVPSACGFRRKIDFTSREFFRFVSDLPALASLFRSAGLSSFGRVIYHPENLD